MKFKDRIKQMIRLRPDQIEPHPMNYKHHTDEQRKHFRTILSNMGIAGAIIVREHKKGKYQLIGGHMRREEINQPIPALVLDVTAKEATQLLAMLDTVAELADTDDSVMAELVDSIKASTKDFNETLAFLCPTIEPGFNEFPLPEEEGLEAEPPRAQPSEAIPATGTRQVPIVFTSKQKAEFIQYVSKLNGRYKTDNYSDCTLEAFKEWEKKHAKGNKSKTSKPTKDKVRR